MNTHPLALAILTLWLITIASSFYAMIFIDLTAGIGIGLFACLLTVLVVLIVSPSGSIYG
jgi:hypothetical protein